MRHFPLHSIETANGYGGTGLFSEWQTLHRKIHRSIGPRSQSDQSSRKPSRLVAGLLLERKDVLPVILHANDGPASLLGLGHERVREGPDLGVRSVGVFAFRIVVM